MSVLNYTVWLQIQRLFLERIYLPMKKDRVKGYLLIATDGTFVTLPKSDVLNQCFLQWEVRQRISWKAEQRVQAYQDSHTPRPALQPLEQVQDQD